MGEPHVSHLRSTGEIASSFGFPMRRQARRQEGFWQ